MVREGDGVAAQTLKKFGIEHGKAVAVVESIVGKGEEKDILTGNGDTPFLDEFGEGVNIKHHKNDRQYYLIMP